MNGGFQPAETVNSEALILLPRLVINVTFPLLILAVQIGPGVLHVFITNCAELFAVEALNLTHVCCCNLPLAFECFPVWNEQIASRPSETRLCGLRKVC